MAVYEVAVSKVTTPGAKRRNKNDIVTIRKPLGKLGPKDVENHDWYLMDLTATFVAEFWKRKSDGEKYPFKINAAKFVGNTVTRDEVTDEATFTGPVRKKNGNIVDKKVGI